MKVNFKGRQGNASKSMCVFIYFFIQSAVVSCADINYLNETIRAYFADTRHHYSQFASYKTRAKEFIFNEFSRFGLETVYQHFNETGFGGSSFTNVIGVKKGVNFGKSSDKVLMIMAHYDTVSTTKGVDDNGAGVAAILEVAKQLHERKASRENTVIFVSPDLEESGLIGSKHFVQTWLPTWSKTNYGTSDAVRKTTQGCIVLDTVMEYNTSDHSQKIPDPMQGFQLFFPEQMASIASDDYEGDFLTLVYRKNPDASLATNFKRSWTAQKQDHYELEYFALPIDNELPTGTQRIILLPFLRSDHANFWSEDMPAIFITDTADYRGDMTECYHQACDNVKIMLTNDNLRFLGKTADSLTSTIDALSKVSAKLASGQNKSFPNCAIVLILTVCLSHLWCLALD